MNKPVFVTGWVVAVVMATSLAWAAAAPKPSAATGTTKPTEVTGKIRSVDVVNEVVKLEDGQFYLVPPSIKLDGLKAGDQVTLSGDKDQYGRLEVKTLTKTN
jgi:hypothetical protein